MKHLLVVLAIVGAALAPARKLAAQALYTGDGGKGIVIAVPAPVMPNPTAQDNWAPQVLQDLLTGFIARCSAMTVVDRSNQDLAVAEQKNAENDLFLRRGVRVHRQHDQRPVCAGRENPKDLRPLHRHRPD